MLKVSQYCCSFPQQTSQWKCGLYSKTVCLLINAAFVLSILSSLDCKFVVVDVGFIPFGFQTSNVGLGLWSIQDPEADDESGRCLLPWRSKAYGDLSGGASGEGQGSYYGKLLTTDDSLWALSQIAAFIGMITNLMNMTLSWTVACCSEEECGPYAHWLMMISSICFTLEGFKLGFFSKIKACTSDHVWMEIGSKKNYQYPQKCVFSWGSYFSLCAIICQTLSLIFLCGHLLFPIDKSEKINEGETNPIKKESQRLHALKNAEEGMKNSKRLWNWNSRSNVAQYSTDASVIAIPSSTPRITSFSKDLKRTNSSQKVSNPEPIKTWTNYSSSMTLKL